MSSIYDLIPPSNEKYKWQGTDWQLLCYYCNQPIYETKPVAGYRQRTLYMRGKWRHIEGDELKCNQELIRPAAEIDLPHCHVCTTQTTEHKGFCSLSGLSGFRATPMSEKEAELERAIDFARRETKKEIKDR
jgi:hypothetical protein